MLLCYIISCVDYLLLTGFAKLKLNSLKIKTLKTNTNLKYTLKDIITVINKSDQKAKSKKYFLKKMDRLENILTTEVQSYVLHEMVDRQIQLQCHFAVMLGV